MSRTLLKGIGLVVVVVIFGIIGTGFSSKAFSPEIHLTRVSVHHQSIESHFPWMFVAVIAVYTGSLLGSCFPIKPASRIDRPTVWTALGTGLVPRWVRLVLR